MIGKKLRNVQKMKHEIVKNLGAIWLKHHLQHGRKIGRGIVEN